MDIAFGKTAVLVFSNQVVAAVEEIGSGTIHYGVVLIQPPLRIVLKMRPLF